METKKFPPYTVCHSHYVSHRQHWMATLLGGIVAPTWRIRRSNWIQWFFFNLFAGKERILKLLIPQQRNIKHVLRWTWIHTLIHHPQFSLLISSTTNFKSVENLLKRMIDFCCYTLQSPLRLLSSIDYSTTIHSPLWSATVSHLYSAVQHDTTFLLVLKFDSVPHHLQTDMPPTDHHWGGVSGGEG